MEPDSQARSLTPSLLDRLIDENINAERDPLVSRSELEKTLLASLTRDLVRLLNTRSEGQRSVGGEFLSPPTLVDFGLPEYAGLKSVHPEEIRQALTASIQAFEPRLQDVRVHVSEEPMKVVGALTCRISARIGRVMRTLTVTLPSQVQGGSAGPQQVKI